MLNRALRFRYSARVQKLIKFVSSCWTSHISFIPFNSTISNETHLSIPSMNVCVRVRAHVYVCLLSLLCLCSTVSWEFARVCSWILNMFSPFTSTLQKHFPPCNCQVTSTWTHGKSRQCHVRYGSSFILRLKTPISNSISSPILLGHFSQGCEVHLSLSHELDMRLITASAVSSNTLRNPNMSSLHGKLLKKDLGGRFQRRSMAIYN